MGWREDVCLGALASPCALIHTIAVSATHWSSVGLNPLGAAASRRAEFAFAVMSREIGLGLAYSVEGLDGDNLNREDDMGGPCTAFCVGVSTHLDCNKSRVVFWFARDSVAASSSLILSSVASSSSVTELESTCKQFLLSRSSISRHSFGLTTPRISMTLALLTEITRCPSRPLEAGWTELLQVGARRRPGSFFFLSKNPKTRMVLRSDGGGGRFGCGEYLKP